MHASPGEANPQSRHGRAVVKPASKRLFRKEILSIWQVIRYARRRAAAPTPQPCRARDDMAVADICQNRPYDLINKDFFR